MDERDADCRGPWNQERRLARRCNRQGFGAHYRTVARTANAFNVAGGKVANTGRGERLQSFRSGVRMAIGSVFRNPARCVEQDPIESFGINNTDNSPI